MDGQRKIQQCINKGERIDRTAVDILAVNMHGIVQQSVEMQIAKPDRLLGMAQLLLHRAEQSFLGASHADNSVPVRVKPSACGAPVRRNVLFIRRDFKRLG